uniref:Pyruvate phosphate dikinase AMP/ATP-binding domain-containing protein n=1 Tax=Chrysotila carterae TaxID=13221 RepID=A0A7S4F8R5_CHRCT
MVLSIKRLQANMPRGPVEEEPFGKSALTTHKPIFTFGIKHDGAPAVASPKENLKWLLGGKGAGLAQMASIGLPVPPGFTITTEVCAVYGKYNRNLPDAIWSEVMDGVLLVEKQLGRTLGDETSPLLLSVRSGAAISMPGMMDTVLNLGLNDVTVEAIAKETANERCAFDSYRRFLDMFGDVVMGIPHADFEAELDALKKSSNVEHDSDLSVDQLKELVQRYKAVYAKHNIEFPDDPHEQLGKAIHAVFDSWDSTRAKKYRSLQNITGLVGTAVNVQAMVFGNMGDTSGTGVLFTRCPNDGTNELFGEFLVNAQGEDVVAGIRTPKPIAQLRDDFPEIYAQLRRTCDRLEEYFKDMQDVEFTVQEGTLFILQTRNGKRSGAAAVAIAVDMVEQGLISMEEAILQVTPEHLDTMLHNQFTNVHAVEYTSAVIAKGLNASPGAAVGVACFSSAEVEHKRKDGISAILIRHETSPEDVAGMCAAEPSSMSYMQLTTVKRFVFFSSK